VGLSGNFKETSFADLLQFYSVSKQTVAVTVRIGAGERVDGVFYFADGDLVGAALGGTEGREAVRRALRLREGSFSVELGAKPAGAPSREALRNVVMEEVVRLDEENRATSGPAPAPKHSGAVAAGAGWWAGPDAAPPRPQPSGLAAPTPLPPTAARPGGRATPVLDPRTTPPASGPAALQPAAARPAAAGRQDVTGPMPPAASSGPGPAVTGPMSPAAPPASSQAVVTGPLPSAAGRAPVARSRSWSEPEFSEEPVYLGSSAAPGRGPAQRPPAPAQAVSVTSPASKPPPSPGEPARRAPPAPPAPPPPPARFGVGLLAAMGVAAVALFGGIAWYVLAGKRPAPPEPPARVAAAPAATPAAAPSAAPSPGARGVLDDTIVLGMVASFTGSNKERGRAMRIGWDTAIAEVNEAGGVHGRKLKLVAYDDGYDPARTLPAMKDVVEGQGAFAIVGNVGTATSAVAAPYAAEKDAVFFGALSGADVLRKTPPDRNVFNFRASLQAEGAAAVRYLVDVRRLPPRKIAILAQDDDFGRSGQKGALAQLARYGVKEDDVLKLSYPRNTADVREAVAKIRERPADTEAVVMVATYKPAATFVRKSKDAKLNLFYTTVSADSNGLAEELVLSGEGYTDRVLLTQVVPVPTAGASLLMRYRKELERHAPGEKPGSTSLEAWIGAQIFVEALKRAGRSLDSAKLVAALEGIRGWDIGIGGPIAFGPDDHQGSDMVFGWLLQPDGTYRQVDLE